MHFTNIEREKLAVLVNNISVYAAQLLAQGSPDLVRRALTNLAKLKKEQEQLLKQLDEFAGERNEERPLRLVEDLSSVPRDIAQTLMIVRRCC